MKKSLQIIGFILSASAFVSAAAAIYIAYKNNVWRPFIDIKEVDWKKGYAKFLVDGKEKKLYGDSTVAIGGDWGIRFGKDPQDNYNRLELVKTDLVYKTVTINS